MTKRPLVKKLQVSPLKVACEDYIFFSDCHFVFTSVKLKVSHPKVEESQGSLVINCYWIMYREQLILSETL